MASNQQSSIAMSKEVIEAIISGRKIQAIKLLREEKGFGLKEAKEAVDAHIDNNADIKEAFNANQASGSSIGGAIKIAILIIVLLVLYKMI